MTRFLRNDPGIEFSPDGRYFAVVTSRGNVRSNQIESTLQVFRVQEVLAYLRAGDETARPPEPRAVARVSAVPRTQYFDSYGPAMFAFRWLPDSRALVFQGEGATGERRLYRADLSNGAARALSPAGFDVTEFATTTSDTVAYAAISPKAVVRPAGEPINADASDVTGKSLDEILFPYQYNNVSTSYSNLWVTRGGKVHEIVDKGSGAPLRILIPTGRHVFSASRDGRFLVVLVPVTNVPPAWTNLEPNPALPLRRIKADADTTSSTNLLPPKEYALVDLRTGAVAPLIHAPTGNELGWGRTGATWSTSGSSVLIVNPFLSNERYPCMAAVVDVGTMNARCVRAFSADKGMPTETLGASFGGNSNEVVLHQFMVPRTYTDEYYRYENAEWKLVRSTNGSISPQQFPSRTLSIAVRQDLNTPPALWATNSSTKVVKRLWDPNPQLAGINLGAASLFRWKDSSGHDWVGELLKPPNFVAGNRYPLVIQTHAAPSDEIEFLTDGPETTAFAARPLASSGMIVLQMPINWAHPISPQDAPDQIRGFDSAIAELSAEGLVDPSKVGAIGFSRTGWPIESAMIKEPKLFAAAVIADSTDASYMQYLIYSPAVRSDGERIYGASPFGDGINLWAKEAPDFHVDQIQSPILIQAIEGSGGILGEWELYSGLSIERKPVDLMYIRKGQHILQKPLSRIASQQGSVDWLRFWLQGYEDSDRAKVAQYARWRKLRANQEQGTAHGKPADE